LNKYSTQQDFYKSNNNIFNLDNTQSNGFKQMKPERDINSGAIIPDPDWHKKLKNKKK
jgi:hypothetical protein